MTDHRAPSRHAAGRGSVVSSPECSRGGSGAVPVRGCTRIRPQPRGHDEDEQPSHPGEQREGVLDEPGGEHQGDEPRRAPPASPRPLSWTAVSTSRMPPAAQYTEMVPKTSHHTMVRRSGQPDAIVGPPRAPSRNALIAQILRLASRMIP